MWSRYEGFEIGDKTVKRPFLRLEWVTGKGRVDTFKFGVEKAKAIISMYRKVAEFAATYG